MSETVGRVHSAKERSDLKDVMDINIEQVASLYARRDLLTDAQQDLLAQQESLMMTGTLTPTQVQDNKNHIALYGQQIKSIDRQLGTSEVQRIKDVQLQIPTNMNESKKGVQLVTHVDAFSDEYRAMIPYTRWLLKRIGHDIHPDNGLFWGHAEYHSEDERSDTTNLTQIPTACG